MAITPRTMLSEPVGFVVLGATVIALAAIAGLVAGPDAAPHPPATGAEVDSAEHAAPTSAPTAQPGRKVGARSRPPSACGRPWLTDSGSTDSGPTDSDAEPRWLAYLACLDDAGVGVEAHLAATDRAISAVGLTPKLAVRRADDLQKTGATDTYIAFLDDVVRRIGVVDGRLVNPLSRALIWRGRRADLGQIRHLLLLARMLMPESCQVLQSEIWAHFLMAKHAANRPSTSVWAGVRRAAATYRKRGCTDRLHHGRWDELAEVLGVAVAADATGQAGSNIPTIADIARAYRIQDARRLCRDAIPNRTGLRGYCQRRLNAKP